MSRIGYGRVSTRDQNPDAQQDALKAAACDRVYIDQGVSGRLARRPELDKALDFARAGDALVITKLDRLGRSVKNLVDEVLALQARGIDLVVTDQGIDTTTPGGRLLFHVMAAIAEFETAMISERTRDGLAAARARGRKGGRKPKLNARQVALARELYDRRDRTVQQIATDLGCSRPTVYRALSSSSSSPSSSLSSSS